MNNRIWIDLDNSPHVPFFAPLITELSRKGYELVVTAREAYQVRELAVFFGVDCEFVGRHYGKNKALKVIGTCVRAAQLAHHIRPLSPRLCVSHGSRAQIVASSFFGIPSIAIIDYEFVHRAPFVQPSFILTPDVIPRDSFRSFSATVLTYRGIKEDVYLPYFRPDPTILERLGVRSGAVVVTVRPPASDAHYHSADTDSLFVATLDRLNACSEIVAIILPRTSAQEQMIRNRWQEALARGTFVIPRAAEDGLNLIWHSDLVISGGGTMNREAAALHVPVFSIFRSQIGSVDKYLVQDGRLIFVSSVEEVATRIQLRRRTRDPEAPRGNGTALGDIVSHITTLAPASDLAE